MINNIKITFFAILLLGAGSFLMSATTPYKSSGFDWSKAYDTHYYTTGYGVRIAKIKKDTDPPKKKTTTENTKNKIAPIPKVSVAQRVAAIEGTSTTKKATTPPSGQYQTAKTLVNRVNQTPANNQYQTLPKKPTGAPDNKIQMPKSSSAPGRLPSNQYGKVNNANEGNGQYKSARSAASNNQYQTLPKKPTGAPDNKIQTPAKVNKQYESTNVKMSGGSANKLPVAKSTAPKPRVPTAGRPLPTPPAKAKNSTSTTAKATTKRKKH